MKTTKSCLANPMNNYNLYFSNKPSLTTKLDQNISIQQPRGNGTKWSPLINETHEVITSKKSAHSVNNNNYFNYKKSIEDATSKLTFSNDMILARSMTYDYRFKAEFIDSKLNLATAIAAKSSEPADKNTSQIKKAIANQNDLKKPSEEPNENKEIRHILQNNLTDTLSIDQPKLSYEEEMLVAKSKQKCNDWFDKHFSYSNTSSPINDLNEF